MRMKKGIVVNKIHCGYVLHLPILRLSARCSCRELLVRTAQGLMSQI